MTSLRDELGKDIPELSSPSLALLRIRLAEESERLGKLYGGATADIAPRSDDYEEAKAALEGNKTILRSIPARLLPCVPFVVYDNREWRSDKSIINSYLGRIEHEARWYLLRSLWTKYLLGFENGDPATDALARFLRRHSDKLPQRLAQFSDRYNVLDPKEAPLCIARETLKGQEIVGEFETIGLNVARIRSSSFIVAILGSVGRLLESAPPNGDPVIRIRALWS